MELEFVFLAKKIGISFKASKGCMLVTDVDNVKMMDSEDVSIAEIERNYIDVMGRIQSRRRSYCSGEDIPRILHHIFELESKLHTFGIPSTAPYKIDNPFQVPESSSVDDKVPISLPLPSIDIPSPPSFQQVLIRTHREDATEVGKVLNIEARKVSFAEFSFLVMEAYRQFVAISNGVSQSSRVQCKFLFRNIDADKYEPLDESSWDLFAKQPSLSVYVSATIGNVDSTKDFISAAVHGVYSESIECPPNSESSMSSSTRGCRRDWQYVDHPKMFPSLVGMQVVAVNGVHLRGLDKKYQLSLLRSSKRPLRILFEPVPMDYVIPSSDNVYPVKISSSSVQAQSSNVSAVGMTDDPKVSEDTSDTIPSPVLPNSSSIGLDTGRAITPSQINFERDEDIGISRGNSGIPAIISPALESPFENGRQRSSIAGMSSPVIKSNQLHFATFVAKYTHPSSSRLRKKIEDLMHAYVECDWVAAKREGTGVPQATITSLYRFIEAEMIKLGLFDNTKAAGSGVPDMSDEVLTDLRNHIETFVFKRIYSYTLSLGPLLIDSEAERSMLQVASQSNKHALAIPAAVQKTGVVQSLNMKLAYLSFAGLSHLGLHLDSNPVKIDSTIFEDGFDDTGVAGADINRDSLSELGSSLPKSSSSLPRYSLSRSSSFSQRLHTVSGVHDAMSSELVFSANEEWVQAAKGLSRALQADAPNSILAQLVEVVRQITAALEAHMRNSKRYVKFGKSSPYSFQCPCCKIMHTALLERCVTTDEYGKVHAPLAWRVVRGFGGESGLELNSSESDPGQPMLPNVPSAEVDDVTREESVQKKESIDDDEEDNTDNDHYHVQITADDLLPAIAWVIIQANPPNIDAVLWLCSEFRHTELFHGEESFCLSQISSAVEFCRNATAVSFEMTELDYASRLMKYESTMQLLQCCRKGDTIAVVKCLNDGADVNGLSPDQRDNALTACIRFNKFEPWQVLLGQRNANVNIIVSPYHGPHQWSTPLMVAAKLGRFRFVLSLLKQGADRYVTDESGNTALMLAASGKFLAVQVVLAADPAIVNYETAIELGNEEMLVGLLLQQASLTGTVRSNKKTALMMAVESGQVAFVRNILFLGKVEVDARCEDSGETALILAVKRFSFVCRHFGFTESLLRRLHDVVIIIAMLLRAKASITISDSDGRRALDYARDLFQEPYFFHTETDFTAASIVLGPQILSTRDIIFSYRKRLLYLLSLSPITTPIYAAVEYLDCNAVWSLIALGGNCNEICPVRQVSALIGAVFKRNIELVNLLLRSSDIVDETDYSKGFALEIYYDTDDVPLEQFFPVAKVVRVPPIQINAYGAGGMTALHHAAQLGDSVITGLLLAAGADRTVTSIQRQTPLDLCTRKGSIDTLNMLKYDPNTVPICLAAKHGDWLVLSALLRQGVSINSTRPVSRTTADSAKYVHETYSPLIASIFYKQSAVVQSLLAIPGIDLNLSNEIGRTPLMYAALAGDEALVIQLLKLEAKRGIRDVEGKSASDVARECALDSIEMILKCDPRKHAVHEAVRWGNYAATVALFKQGVDPNLVYDPAQYESGTDYISRSSQQVATQAGMSSPASAPLPASSSVAGFIGLSKPKKRQSDPEPVTLLDGLTPLMVAAAYNQASIASLLLKAPEIKLNLCDGARGWTALCHAAYRGSEEVLLLLLKAGANRYVKTLDEKMASDVAYSSSQLMCAALLEADPYRVHIHDLCYEGKVLLAQALIKQGCPPCFRDDREGKWNLTPLMAACHGAQYEVTKMLLGYPEVRQGINEVDIKGRTALMLAARAGSLEITSLLLNARADRNMKDKVGNTARDHALAHGYSTMFQFMSQQLVH